MQARILLIDTLSFAPYIIRTLSQDDLASLRKAPSSLASSHTLTRVHINGNPSSNLPSTSCVQTLLSRTSGGKRVRYKCTRIQAYRALHLCTYVCTYTYNSPLFSLDEKGCRGGYRGGSSRAGACERARFFKQNGIYSESEAR